MPAADASLRDRLFAAVACQLAVAMLLGGTARPLHVFAALLASLPTLYLLLAGKRRSVAQGRVLAAALTLFGLAWLQLVPLPPAIWTALPGRDLAAQALAVAGLDPGWRPIALDPGAAFASLLACTAPLVMLAAFARLTDSERAALLQAVVAFALLSAMLGIAQRLTGTLTPYDIDHAGYATGLFANRNHLAALLACAIVLAPAALTWGDGTARHLLAGGAIAVLAAGIAATTSRAGIALGVAAILALPVAYRSGWRMAAGAGLTLLVLLLAIAQLPALAPVAERFAALGDDQRLIMAETTWKAAQAFFPWGSGWGSFVEIYMAWEDLDTMDGRFVVAAHNDYLQLALEGGLIGWLVAAAGPAALVFSARRTFAPGQPDAARAWWCVAALLLLHSAADFPLRTPALATLLAAAFASLDFAWRPLRAAPSSG